MKYKFEDVLKAYESLYQLFQDVDVYKLDILEKLMGTDDAVRCIDFIKSADDLLKYIKEQEEWENKAEALKKIKENEQK